MGGLESRDVLSDHSGETFISPVMKRALRRVFRLARLVLHSVVGAVVVRLVYPFVSRETRMGLRARWCRRVLNVLGVDLRVVGTVPPGCNLIAANHISWLDVFVVGAVFPCWYVSKSETRAWPFIGWMAQANDTLFLRRWNARAAYRMNREVRARLESGEPVVVFPEGTTTDGTHVLDFYPALFQPAVDKAVPVLPLALCYRDAAGLPATAVAYIDEDPLWNSLREVLDAPRTEARLALDPVLDPRGRKRREFAADACHAIRRMQLRQAPPTRVEERRPAPATAVFEPAGASD
jgi:1-acyl-sn-glycerol-3-phosphate acyltransferase